MNLTKLDNLWKSEIKRTLNKEILNNLNKFLSDQRNCGAQIYPSPSLYYEALNQTPLSKVKVVILGQDPYHGPGQAHGLCFSVNKHVKVPPSLKNIYKEQERDLKIKQAQHGQLSQWAEQGVLLLNSTLTVEAGKAGSHQKKGWEEFTSKIIEIINTKKQNIVYMLWGAYGQKKGSIVCQKNNLVLKTVHPSPLSAYRGFIGCGHFSKANEYLVSKGLEPINWQIN